MQLFEWSTQRHFFRLFKSNGDLFIEYIRYVSWMKAVLGRGEKRQTIHCFNTSYTTFTFKKWSENATVKTRNRNWNLQSFFAPFRLAAPLYRRRFRDTIDHLTTFACSSKARASSFSRSSRDGSNDDGAQVEFRQWKPITFCFRIHSDDYHERHRMNTLIIAALAWSGILSLHPSRKRQLFSSKKTVHLLAIGLRGG